MKSPATSVKRMLVVEDEPAIAQICVRTLTREGLEVDIAVDGNVAKGMLEKEDYSLCLIDVRTPVMDGKQLYQFIIRKYPKLVNGVMFTTGDVMDGYTERFLELTGRPFIFKPFTPDGLRIIVRETLGLVKKVSKKQAQIQLVVKKKILIADDEQSVRTLVKRLLSQNYIILEAKDGAIAVDIARREKPDLILMDIMMPMVDGYNACYQIKRDKATKSIPVVMLTGIGHELNKRLSWEVGARGYLTKPFSLQDLLDTIGLFLPAS